METTTFIKRDGKVQFLGKTLEFILSLLKNGTYTVVIKRKSEKRSVSQNALMWMWFACIADNTGNTKEDVHDAYCLKFLTHSFEIDGKWYRVPGRTSELDMIGFTEFLNKVQADAGTELGIILPNPEDLMYEEFYQTYKNRI